MAIFSLKLSAQSPSLYGSSVAESAIVVRLVNASTRAQKLEIGAQVLEASGFGQASAYKPVAADIYTLMFAGKRIEFIPQKSSYYTLIALDDRLLVLKDQKHSDPARAQLYFYNLTGMDGLELRTADGAGRILGPLSSMDSTQAAVNALSFDAGVYASAILDRPVNLRLVRGESLAVFVAETAQGMRVFSIQARVAAD